MNVIVLSNHTSGNTDFAMSIVEMKSLSWRMAKAAGLIDGAKTKHLNAKVSPKLFAEAARRLGTESPSAVIEAALAALATQDDLGPWLASQWGSLADMDTDLLDQAIA